MPSKDFCGTCHDVSNPVVGDLAPNNGAQTSADEVKPFSRSFRLNGDGSCYELASDNYEYPE